MSRSFARIAVFLLLASLRGVSAQEGLSLSAQAETAASLRAKIAAPFSVSLGSAAGLGLLVEGSRQEASLRARARLSLLQGKEASDLWLVLSLPGSGGYLLSAPAFDPASAAPTAILALALEELALRGRAGPISFQAGLSHANWGMGKAFSPADFFTGIDYSSGRPSRRSIVLAKATWYPTPVSSLELVMTPYSRIGKALALRGYATILDALTVAVSAGLHEDVGSSFGILMGGAELSVDLPYVSPYGEAAASLDPAKGWNLEYSILAGAEARIADVSLAGEYLFAPSETAVHSLYGAAAWKIDEWFSLALPLSYTPSPESLSFGAALSASGLGSMEYQGSLSWEKNTAGDWFIGFILQAGMSL